MNKAIEIVEVMIAKVNAELDDVQSNYKRTSPDSIYDVGYRRCLEQIHDRLITKTVALEDVVRELEKAEGGEACDTRTSTTFPKHSSRRFRDMTTDMGHSL